MKKFVMGTLFLLMLIGICFLEFGYRVNAEPTQYYKVYLDGEVIGVIDSKEKLDNYIDKQNDEYRNKFGVDKVASPNGLDVERVLSYDDKLDKIEDVYQKILKKRPFTINGYQFTINSTVREEHENKRTKEKTKTTKIYVTDQNIFKESVENIITTFVGKEKYEQYQKETQSQITTTGTYLDSIYLEDNITIKRVKIPVTENIYISSDVLTKFLLFGTVRDQKKYKVKRGDTIESVAFNNKISTEEFLISNPTFTSEKSLLFEGQEVVIGVMDPQVHVVVESSTVQDIVKRYSSTAKYDSTMQRGTKKVVQKGENGLERVNQKVKAVNGSITYIKPIGKKELKSPIPEIVVYGQKAIPSVGITGNWLWPTRSGYTISSGYGYRVSPFSSYRELHTGLDISGTGYGSPIYASNNGKVVTAQYHYSYGKHVVINHNNGYSSMYAHMSRIAVKVGQVVARGQIIGYVGATGSATGPHLHFEVWRGLPYTGSRLNPSGLNYSH